MENKISKIFNLNPKLIYQDQLQYFNLNPKYNICSKNEKVLFENIKPFDFIEPIKILYKKYKLENFKKLLKFKFDSSKIYANSSENINSFDEIMMYYSQCSLNNHIITCWDRVKHDDLIEVINFLKKNGNVYYIRKFRLNNKELENLIYQLYSDTFRLSDIKSIRDKINYTSDSKDEKTIYVILFDNVNNLKLSGGQSAFKTDIRNILVKKYNNKYRGDDFIHVNDNFCQTVEYSQLYFNSNSMNLLKSQNLENFISPKFYRARVLFYTYKNWLMKNTNLLERMNFCCISSSATSAYGIRPARDIDAHYNDFSNSLTLKVKKDLFDDKTRFFFTDIGSVSWKKNWIEANKKWLGTDNIEEEVKKLIMNPENYFYFLGIKIYSLEKELYRKAIKIGSPKTLADVYYINLNTNIKVKSLENNKLLLNFLEKQSDRYKSKFKYFLSKKYNINI